VEGWSAREGEAGDGVVVSPFGTAPKSNRKLRTINHLSWPRRRKGHPSVDAGIKIEWVTMTSDSLDKLLHQVGHATHECALGKGYFTDAFCHAVVC
jgi:hypothetical protein